MIEAAPGIWILDDEITERAARASGPGGQHVKTVHVASPGGQQGHADG